VGARYYYCLNTELALVQVFVRNPSERNKGLFQIARIGERAGLLPIGRIPPSVQRFAHEAGRPPIDTGLEPFTPADIPPLMECFYCGEKGIRLGCKNGWSLPMYTTVAEVCSRCGRTIFCL